jgi:hypothetical protein
MRLRRAISDEHRATAEAGLGSSRFSGRVMARRARELACLCSRHVLLAQNGRDELAAAPHACLLKDRLPVILDGVLGDVQLVRDLVRRERVEHEAADLLLLFGKAVDVHHDSDDLVGGLDLDRDYAAARNIQLASHGTAAGVQARAASSQTNRRARRASGVTTPNAAGPPLRSVLCGSQSRGGRDERRARKEERRRGRMAGAVAPAWSQPCADLQQQARRLRLRR